MTPHSHDILYQAETAESLVTGGSRFYNSFQGATALMWDTFIASVLLAGITALGVLAYKHPAAYARIFIPFVIVLTIVFLCTFSWNYGTIKAHIALIKFITPGEKNAATHAINSLQVPHLIPIYAAVVAYLYLLWFLRLLLESSEGHKEGKSAEETKLSKTSKKE